MSPESQKEVWEEIRRAGDRLVGHLPPSPSHPKGRNPYAHLALSIKQKFGCSYKDIPDEKISSLFYYLRKLEEREKVL
jgi:hypothetical protein